MKVTGSFILATLIASTIAQCPNGVRTRPNYLTMSQDDKDKFHNAIKTMNSDAGGNIYQNFTATHAAVGSGAHGSPGFFVWHRRFIRYFEQALQKVDPSIMLPYWDWTRDSQAPETSQIFANNNMGPNGGTGNGGCINTGTFAGWRVQSANSGCVARYFSGGRTIRSWTAPEIMDNYLNQNTRYDNFRQQLESSGHALVHTGIGGNNGDMSFMYSTNDPIFWIHHGFIDYMWWEWQQRHASAARDYPSNPDTARLATYGIPVSSTFDTTSSEYCYTYPRWTVNAPPVDGNTPPTTTSTAPTTTAAQPTTIATTSAAPPTTIQTTTAAPTTTISTTTAPSPTPTNPFGSCPAGMLGIIIGCRTSRRALDLSTLIPEIPKFPGYVSPTDRTTVSKIRVPDQVPASYLQMNGIDPSVALTTYLQSAIIACKLNLIPGFKPLVSL
ncbi:Di-copper centre-containing protein [Conidiobolus coronatus NRRL 28638]|uniref:Di-copper centre-containing protein n=1 Tax=Conidiobolus coronatus (strain ATCC 28846 / CBS 209.66 / NRRL 28638) TaxID=796925 RepID=A0A137PC75_CONC2|nr:Di-copper centre-containing protein [Conidiobolus coronatus NRRL 28638]|eukprot:KXN72575.1 Di-copper centre-containing protein [Conidiobolus coronatus NRRL 28638]